MSALLTTIGVLAAALDIAAGSAATIALAQPASPAHEDTGAKTDTPLSPKDGAGKWTLSSKGGVVCYITLKTARSPGGGYLADIEQPCRDAYPLAGSTGWTPTADGVALVGPDGSPAVTFSRWSDSLLVSHRSSGVDLQLTRGAPPPAG